MLKNAILFWPRFFTEVYYTRKYYNAVNSISSELIEKGLRIDWIGRIYTVVTIKDEFASQPEMVQQSIVFQQLKPISDILLKYGLSDLSYPEISKIKGTNQFLVVLFPENDYFNWPSFIRNIIFGAIVISTGFGISYLVNVFL
jgi:hypothetical protein